MCWIMLVMQCQAMSSRCTNKHQWYPMIINTCGYPWTGLAKTTNSVHGWRSSVARTTMDPSGPKVATAFATFSSVENLQCPQGDRVAQDMPHNFPAFQHIGESGTAPKAKSNFDCASAFSRFHPTKESIRYTLCPREIIVMQNNEFCPGI